MILEALRHHAFRVLDLVADGRDETARVRLLHLNTLELEALGEVADELRALITEVLTERAGRAHPGGPGTHDRASPVE